ncbi:VacJ family lipoprotein [Aquisalimonas sp.]|uniref:MlaA family lipoprotein n=1 Tax=Aquisalimonas sp. TaxID=1872621 RepID=UPI0025B9AAC9|nr:VacJ family lipoprotein [Aquisalimonas sp.]
MDAHTVSRLRLLTGPMLVLLSALVVTACASSPPPPEPDAWDPIEPVNRQVYDFNEQLDRFVAKPLADAYVFVTPRFARRGVTNFFNNMGEPGNAVNNLLQGKPGDSARDTGRFLINTTLGLAGLFDVATPLGLQDPSDEDFGQTLAVWGTPEGMYLVLPAYGPSTTRDIHDIPVSLATNPVSYAGGVIALPLYALNLVNTRARLEQAARFRSEAALDEYDFTRSAYRQYRDNLIWDGDPPEADFFDDLDDDFDW